MTSGRVLYLLSKVGHRLRGEASLHLLLDLLDDAVLHEAGGRIVGFLLDTPGGELALGSSDPPIPRPPRTWIGSPMISCLNLSQAIWNVEHQIAFLCSGSGQSSVATTTVCLRLLESTSAARAWVFVCRHATGSSDNEDPNQHKDQNPARFSPFEFHRLAIRFSLQDLCPM